MKKFLTLMLTLIISVSACLGLTACGGDGTKPYEGIKKIDNLADIKVGIICLHGESSTYDKNFIDAFNAACEAKGVQKVIKVDIAESTACYDTAADLVDQGCDIIFADSFGHEEHMLKAAKEFPEVQFCHATGTYAHTEERGNFQNAFASIYEGRYLAGIAGGMKLKAMIDAGQIKAENKDANGNIKVGYVGAWTYAEVISGLTSWFLGVRSVVPNVVMDVQFTGSWYDEALEKTAAETLIGRGCALISQHADSMGAPTACETAGVPNVSYNGSTAQACPNTFIASSRINWQPYFEYIIDCVNKGEEIIDDYCAGIGSTWSDGSVALTDLGNVAVPGTQEAIDAAIAQFKAGTLKVFDLEKFTVGGEKLADDFKADVDTDSAYTPDTVVIKTTEGGIKYFAESEFRSAPYFALKIDGITYLNEKY